MLLGLVLNNVESMVKHASHAECGWGMKNRIRKKERKSFSLHFLVFNTHKQGCKTSLRYCYILLYSIINITGCWRTETNWGRMASDHIMIRPPPAQIKSPCLSLVLSVLLLSLLCSRFLSKQAGKDQRSEQNFPSRPFAEMFEQVLWISTII